MRRRYLSWLILLVLALSPARAHAQAMASPTGSGIRLGDALVLHLAMGLEFDFDSNPFFDANPSGGVFEMRLLPGFDLTNRPRAAHRQGEFDFNGGLTYLEYP